MTDLEQVREFIGLHTTPTKAVELQAIIDAHLEEDAEKAADALAVEGQLHEKWAELESENARLRSDLDGYMKAAHDYEAENAKLRERLVQCKARWEGAADELARVNDHFNEVVRERDDELAKLGEDASKWKTAWELQDHGACYAEHTRLREELDLKDGLLNQAKGELDRLREERDDARTQRDTALAVVELAEAQRDTLLGALRFLLKQVDEVERTSVVRESNIYRDATAAIAKVEGDTDGR